MSARIETTPWIDGSSALPHDGVSVRFVLDAQVPFAGGHACQVLTSVIRDRSEPPLPGQVFPLGADTYVTVISVRPGSLEYVSGAFNLDMVRDVPEALMQKIVSMPYDTFRRWLAAIWNGAEAPGNHRSSHVSGI